MLAALVSWIESATGEAGARSIAGRWKTVDDRTGRLHAVVRIVEQPGGFEGYVERILQILPGDDPSGLCVRCEGRWKDQPVLGMKILWGLRREGEEYVGGRILDPNDGKIYSCKAKLLEGGEKLQIRGFLGISLLGRTVVWLREEGT
ncbi:hypothetical protein MAMC_00524 [Methylacidimicrobium cyclopophantes]|uniref:DUF2147 domain-containing protein n=1 Tax=Methylacidimicrobium cyclopophantes TaxID=1041766 RepID=A0A5E6M7N9_9BACT|nr:hypothetical protein MAMC_00524 [Methylacidimicrobium cyclopophantes]